MPNHVFVSISRPTELGLDLLPLPQAESFGTVLVRATDDHASDSFELSEDELRGKTAAEVVRHVAQMSEAVADMVQSAVDNDRSITVAGEHYRASELLAEAPAP